MASSDINKIQLINQNNKFHVFHRKFISNFKLETIEQLLTKMCIKFNTELCIRIVSYFF